MRRQLSIARVGEEAIEDELPGLGPEVRAPAHAVVRHPDLLAFKRQGLVVDGYALERVVRDGCACC